MIMQRAKEKKVTRLRFKNSRRTLSIASLRDFYGFEEHVKAGFARRGEPMPSEWYEFPVYYKGNHREVYSHEDAIPWPRYTQRLDFECEIACVIGKRGRDIPLKKAKEYIAGFTAMNDFSARDVQLKEMRCRLGPAKGKDFATALGPYVVSPKEIGDYRDLKMRAKVNGELWSEGNTSELHWSFEQMIVHVSQCETIYPGDVYGSGCYYKGCGLDLNRWIQTGDIVELEIEKIGILRNKIGNPL